MPHDITLTARLRPDSTAMTLSFEAYPKDASYLHFEANGKAFTITADAFKANAMVAIASIPAALGITDGEEMIVDLADGYSLHIALDGNHIRFMEGKDDILYWVCDELQESAETENILGAIAGYAIHPSAIPA